jgi:hypothetical protein
VAEGQEVTYGKIAVSWGMDRTAIEPGLGPLSEILAA